MSKDFPALRMTIEGGRLVPATPFDAERINSYRRGTKVFVKFTEERDRVLVRKWFAILGLVLKQCQTPWKNKDEAHEAIKLALGIVNLSKTVSGQFMQYPKSLSELEDPELQEALEQMTELLSRMTGVDVATLRKEAADVGQEIEHETTGDEEPALDLSPQDDAVASPRQEEAGADVSPASASASSSLSRTDRTDLMECTKKMFAITADEELTPEARRGVLATAKDEWKAYLPAELHDRLRTIFMAADAVIKGNSKRAAVLDEIAYWLECEPKEISG